MSDAYVRALFLRIPNLNAFHISPGDIITLLQVEPNPPIESLSEVTSPVHSVCKYVFRCSVGDAERLKGMTVELRGFKISFCLSEALPTEDIVIYKQLNRSTTVTREQLLKVLNLKVGSGDLIKELNAGSSYASGEWRFAYLGGDLKIQFPVFLFGADFELVGTSTSYLVDSVSAAKVSPVSNSHEIVRSSHGSGMEDSDLSLLFPTKANDMATIRRLQRDVMYYLNKAEKQAPFFIVWVCCLLSRFQLEYYKLLWKTKGDNPTLDEEFSQSSLSIRQVDEIVDKLSLCLHRDHSDRLNQLSPLIDELSGYWDICKKFETSQLNIWILSGNYNLTSPEAPAMLNDYVNLIKACSAIISLIQSVDFEKLVRCRHHLDNGVGPLADKHVVVLIGDTGVGKTTLMKKLFGADLTASPDGNVVASFSDPAVEEKFVSFESNSSVQSVTNRISYLPFPVTTSQNEELYILDTPGLNDTRSVEFSIINSVNIARVLKACRSVRILVVVSKEKMGNRFLAETVKRYFKTLLNLVKEKAHIKYFNYVFTKYEAGDGIPAIIEEGIQTVGGTDSDLHTVLQAMLKKVQNCPLIVSASSDKAPLIQSITVSEGGIIQTPRDKINHCLSDKTLEDLNTQLEHFKTSVRRLVSERNHEYLVYLLNELLIGSKCLGTELPFIAESFSCCLQILSRSVADSFETLHKVQLFCSSAESMCNAIVSVHKLLPILSRFKDPMDISRMSVKDGDELFLRYFDQCHKYLLDGPSCDLGSMKDMSKYVLFCRDAVLQLLGHGCIFKSIKSINDLEFAMKEKECRVKHYVVLVWSPHDADSVKFLRDVTALVTSATGFSESMRFLCIDYQTHSDLFEGNKGSFDKYGVKYGCILVENVDSFEPISALQLSTDVESMLSPFIKVSTGVMGYSTVPKSALDDIISAAVDSFYKALTALVGVKQALSERLKDYSKRKAYAEYAVTLGCVKEYCALFSGAYASIVDATWYVSECEVFEETILSAEIRIVDGLKTLARRESADKIDDVTNEINTLAVVFECGKEAIVNCHLSRTDTIQLKTRISSNIQEFVKSIASGGSIDVRSFMDNVDAMCFQWRFDCIVMEGLCKLACPFKSAEYSTVVLDIKHQATAVVKAVYSNFRTEIDKMRSLFIKDCTEANFGDLELMLLSMQILCREEIQYFSPSICFEACEDIRTTATFFEKITSNDSTIRHDIRVLGKSHMAMKRLKTLLTIATESAVVDTQGAALRSQLVQLTTTSRNISSIFFEKSTTINRILQDYNSRSSELSAIKHYVSKDVINLDNNETFAQREKRYNDLIADCFHVQWCFPSRHNVPILSRTVSERSVIATYSAQCLLSDLETILERKKEHVLAVWNRLIKQCVYLVAESESLLPLLCKEGEEALKQECDYIANCLKYFRLFDLEETESFCKTIEVFLNRLTTELHSLKIKEGEATSDGEFALSLDKIKLVSRAFSDFDRIVPNLPTTFEHVQKMVLLQVTDMLANFNTALARYDFRYCVCLLDLINKNSKESYNTCKNDLKRVIDELLNELGCFEDNFDSSDLLKGQRFWRLFTAISTSVFECKGLFANGSSTLRPTGLIVDFQRVMNSVLSSWRERYKDIGASTFSMRKCVLFIEDMQCLLLGLSSAADTCCQRDDPATPICFGCEKPLETTESTELTSRSSIWFKCTWAGCEIYQLADNAGKAGEVASALFELKAKAISSLEAYIEGAIAPFRVTFDSRSDSDDDSDDEEANVYRATNAQSWNVTKAVDVLVELKKLSVEFNEKKNYNLIEVWNKTLELLKEGWGESIEYLKLIDALFDGENLQLPHRGSSSILKLSECLTRLRQFKKEAKDKGINSLFAEFSGSFVKIKNKIFSAKEAVSRLENRTNLSVRDLLLLSYHGSSESHMSDARKELYRRYQDLKSSLVIETDTNLYEIFLDIKRDGAAWYVYDLYDKAEMTVAIGVCVDHVLRALERLHKVSGALMPVTSPKLEALVKAAAGLISASNAMMEMGLDGSQLLPKVQQCQVFLQSLLHACSSGCASVDTSLTQLEDGISDVGIANNGTLKECMRSISILKNDVDELCSLQDLFTFLGTIETSVFGLISEEARICLNHLENLETYTGRLDRVEKVYKQTLQMLEPFGSDVTNIANVSKRSPLVDNKTRPVQSKDEATMNMTRNLNNAAPVNQNPLKSAAKMDSNKTKSELLERKNFLMKQRHHNESRMSVRHNAEKAVSDQEKVAVNRELKIVNRELASVDEMLSNLEHPDLKKNVPTESCPVETPSPEKSWNDGRSDNINNTASVNLTAAQKNDKSEPENVTRALTQEISPSRTAELWISPEVTRLQEQERYLLRQQDELLFSIGQVQFITSGDDGHAASRRSEYAARTTSGGAAKKELAAVQLNIKRIRKRLSEIGMNS